MSELEQSLIERAARLRQEDAEREASEQAYKAQQEAETRELTEKATRMGLEIIGLLSKYDFEPKKIWEIKQVGDPPGYGISGVRDSVYPIEEELYRGLGWDLYTNTTCYDGSTSTTLHAIHEDGRIFHYQTKSWLRYPLNGATHNERLVAGLFNPTYLQPEQTVHEIASNVFQDELARLIATKL